MGALRKNSVARGIAVLLFLFGVVLCAEGQLNAACLIDCGKKIVFCAENCGIKGGEDSCYENCASENVGCVTTCTGSTQLPKAKYN